MIKITCVDTVAMEVASFAMCLIIVLVLILFILVSYGSIAVALLKIKSVTVRQKAFGTSSFYVIVVSIFYRSYLHVHPARK